MRNIGPVFGGMLAGFVLTALAAGIAFLHLVTADQPDPAYSLVAVSWGTPTNTPSLWFYQVQVLSSDRNSDGVLEISARACIGSSSYYHDFGQIGGASDKGEAVRKFGEVIWHTDKVTIGGEDGIKATLSREQLEKHR